MIAILANELKPNAKITLVESDQRKSAFLRNVLRETGVLTEVVARRIEEVPQVGADVLSARALANLSKLLEFAKHHGREGSVFMFPKGANWQQELTQAQESWKFEYEAITSETDPNAIILKIGGLARA